MRQTGTLSAEDWDRQLRSGAEVGIEVTPMQGLTSQPPLQVEQMAYEASEGRLVRSKVTLTITDWLTRSEAVSRLAPAITDLVIKVWVGPEITGYVWLGRFRITSLRRSRSSTWEVEAEDYGRVLADSRLLHPWGVPAGSDVVGAMSFLIMDGIPDALLVNPFAIEVATAANQVFEVDRAKALEDLAASIGCEWYMTENTATPVVRVRPVPKVIGTPLWTIDAGPNGVLTDVQETWSTDRLYNAVVASGTEALSGVSAVAYQTSGPYAWSATFRRPRYYSSPAITTAAQAESAARSLLARSLTLSEGVAVSAIVNPALEVGDPVLVRVPAEPFRPQGSTATDLPRIVTSVSWTWPPTEAMRVGTRSEADAAVVGTVGGLS